ncbi:uncharacterized protein LOC142323075 isoform X2 [Lycorma delicatula]|uniref:uncharacterized protein LOC142323075 isoform X2 n=1 Tax=Lycorma delicatula TaxID=130591 RepID=UPI003F5145E0
MFAEHSFPKSANTVTSSHGRRGYRKEELIVRRRNAESDRLQLWAGVDDYFKTWDARVNRFTGWSSPEFYNISRLKEIKAQEKEENLTKRRKCLEELLEKEDSEYREELKIIRSGNRILLQNVKSKKDNLCDMNLEIQRRADEAHRREGELKLYHQYTFLHPNQYRRQNEYFNNKTLRDGTENNKGKTDSKNFNNNNKNWSEVSPKDKLKAEIEILKSTNIKMKTEMLQFMSEMERYNENMNSLKTQEMERIKQMSKVTSYFKELMKGDDKSEKENYEQLSSAEYLEYWRKKSKIVQNELKQEIVFLDDAIKVAELVHEFSLKYELEKLKQLFSKKLQLESGRDKLSNLFECSYREPWIWWKEECKMWKADQKERKKLLTQIYLKLETMEEKWCLKNVENQEQLIASQEKALSELENIKKNIEKNEQLLEELELGKTNEYLC